MKPYGDELAQIVSNDKNKGWKEAWNAIWLIEQKFQMWIIKKYAWKSLF